MSGQVRCPAHNDRADDRDQRTRNPAGDPAGSERDHDDRDRHRHGFPVRVRELAEGVREPAQGAGAGGLDPEHVRQLPGGHLDADAGEEAEQDGAGQEVRQEAEPGQPGQQQQSAGEQRGEPGQLDVFRRSGGRQPGEGGSENGCGGGVRADGEVA
jgi:hypothetical protein